MTVSWPQLRANRVDPAPDSFVPGRDKTRARKAGKFKKHLIVLTALFAVSAPLRLMNLQAPFTGEHEFRQTQTALSVWEMRAHGISLLHPKLPLFGPPWECPFEYPVFQIAAAAVDSVAPWKNLDVSIRVTNLAFFYLTAVALYLLMRVLFREKAVALFATAVFLFSMYNVFWSRTSMIESAATFFALAYLGLFIRWSHKPGWMVFAFCLSFGILGCLTKITTFVIPAFVCGGLVGLEAVRLIHERFRSGGQSVDSVSGTAGRSVGSQRANTRERGLRILWLTCLLIVPLIIGQWYTKYGDSIKEKSDYTKWLSSNGPSMKRWVYGTLEQRLDIRKWDIIQYRIQEVVTPCFPVALIIGSCGLPFLIRGFSRLPMGNFWMGCGVVLAPIAAIGLFFNLYFIHTYYLNACAPFFALCAGVGLWLVFKLMRTAFTRLLYVLLVIGLWLWMSSPQLAQASYDSGTDARLDYLSAASKIIPPVDPVIIISATEWSSFAPYYLKRRAFMGMMSNKSANIYPLLENDYFKKNGFHWLLIEGNAPGTAEFAAKIMKRWKISQPVSISVEGAQYVLYFLADE
jgi:hypothetical protein